MLMHVLKMLDSIVQPQADVPRLLISDRFPNTRLVNQLGEHLGFRDDFIEAGKAVVINSMFTTCRGSCPKTSSTIKKLRRELYPVMGQRLVFLSFTLEPEVDNVEKLAQYAKMYGASVNTSNQCDWHLVTSTAEEIERLRRALGFYNLDPRVDSDVTQHGSSLLVGHPEKDRWTSHAAELPLNVLLPAIRRTVGETFQQRYGINA